MRAIDADLLIADCNKYLDTLNPDKDVKEYARIFWLISILRNAPTIEPDPIEPERKKGKWIPQDHNKTTGCAKTLVYYYPKCSECGHSGNYTNFCPRCGADMREDQDG